MLLNFLEVILFIALLFVLLLGVVWGSFKILNLSDEEPKERKPDAWRVKHGNRYYYMDKTEPFPTQGAEPLYLEKK